MVRLDELSTSLGSVRTEHRGALEGSRPMAASVLTARRDLLECVGPAQKDDEAHQGVEPEQHEPDQPGHQQERRDRASVEDLPDDQRRGEHQSYAVDSEN